MRDDERQALSMLRFSWAPTVEEIWSDPAVHVDGFNDNVMVDVQEALSEALDSTGPSPLGIVIAGAHGSGKTHEVRRARKLVQAQGGYFFLLGLPTSDQSIWQKAIHGFRDGLQRKGSHQESQLHVFLNRLADKLNLSDDLRKRITGAATLHPENVQQVVHDLRRKEPYLGMACQYTLRALLMLGSNDFDLQDLAENYLYLQVDDLAAKLGPWGIVVGVRVPEDVAGEISKLLAFTGPIFMAVDQIDSVFSPLRRQIAEAANRSEADAHQRQLDALATEIGIGLMDMREQLWRTVTLVSCLNSSWSTVKVRSPGSVEDRFREVASTRDIGSAEVAERFVTTWIRRKLDGIGFAIPDRTWPVQPAAFATAKGKTPRDLLKCVDKFARASLGAGQVLRVVDFNAMPDVDAPTPDKDDDALRRYDHLFQDLVAKVEDRDPLVDPPDDQELSSLLVTVMSAWIQEQGDRSERFKVLGGKGERPSMHAWLVETLNEETEDEVHWSVRGIPQKSANSYQSHLRKLQTFASIGQSGDVRKAFVLRNEKPPAGPVTARMVREFEDLGGQHLELTPEDVRTMRALSRMIDGQADDGVSQWFFSRRPASGMPLLRKIFGDPSGGLASLPPILPGSGPIEPSADGFRSPPVSVAKATNEDGSNPPVDVEGVASEEIPKDSVRLGYDADTAEAVHLSLSALRKHVAIFAGSGSGKTVLIKRLIEECAIQGVSSIVLDPNNDLARLGDPWPGRPTSWRDFDDRQASLYFAAVDVVVWTPRREAGRPLSLQPLPDFAAVRNDPDEFGLALDTAVAALAPRARMDRKTAKMDKGRAIMREALAHYAREGGSSLTGYIDYLAELPEFVTTLSKAADIAHEISQTLTAAMINDPLFGGSGVPMDPGILLTPAAGKKARVSVISMIGLPYNEQRQSFVNQLQMGLFAWIKRNPAGQRPLGGLFVMDEAQTLAPSGAMTACTESTLALASQARKYGLGLVFATQAPRGIHNRIVGNAATQFYGFLNSQVQIQAAKEMAQAKSSEVLDISRLSAGQFYAVGEGMPFRKVRTPICLSHHPESALTPEEVLERARA